MITGDLKSKIDAVWNVFWTGGISNPLEVIEQITYLLFIKRLDQLHTVEEKKANRLGQKIENAVFKKNEQHLRWSRFKNEEAKKMFSIVSGEVFRFIKQLNGKDSSYARHMKDARFTIPTPGLLAKVVDLIDQVPMADRDTKGDVYEYMLGKIAPPGRTDNSARRGTSSG